MPKPKERTPLDDLLMCPFVVVIDSREQSPFTFQGLTGDAHEKYRPLVVPTTVAGLTTGDYSIVGFEGRIAVERKSLDDAFNTFTHERERFERELERMQAMEFAAVVIEAGWGAILNYNPPARSLNHKTIYRSIVAWQQRYPRTHWWACETRSFAERTCFRMLQRFWLDERDGKRAGEPG